MLNKEIELLKNQISKLDNKNFDLNAWKSYTIVVLGRIFGENNQKIKQIENIKYDFGSWSLRDTLGNSSSMYACKKLAKEILEASISELENFGLPERETKKAELVNINLILTAFEDELKVSQFKEIKKIIVSDEKEEDKKEKIVEKLNSFGQNIAANIIANIITKPQISDKM